MEKKIGIALIYLFELNK